MDIWLSDQPGERYSTRIEDISDEFLTIAMPMTKGLPVIPAANSLVSGRIFAAGAVYGFVSRYIGKKLYPLPVWLITFPQEVQKIQQRAYVRFDVALKACIDIIDGEEVKESIVVNTKDIGGGGIRIISKEAMPIGTKLSIKFDLPNYGVVEALGEVVRSEQPQAEAMLFWIGIKFTFIKETDRTKIIRYIFKKQLEQRQKGLC